MHVEEFDPAFSPFKYVYADVTHRCQMNCANCYLPNREVPDMDIDALISCISKFPHKTDIRLVGGEPTLMPNLPDIIARIKKAGHRPMLITNGLKLADEKLVEKLHSAGLRYIQLSLNGLDDDKIYLITDKMKCAEAKIAGVKNCDRIGISVSVSCILIRGLNDHLVPKFFDFAMGLKTRPRINFRNVGALGRNMRGEIQNLSMAEMVQLVSQASGFSVDELNSSRTADNQIRVWYGAKKRSRAIAVKITDWSIYKEGVPDSKRRQRGRITQDFKVAPFFEHIIANEFGY